MVNVVNFNQAAGKLSELKDGILKNHYVYNGELDDAALERRFSKAQKYPHNVSFEITTNKELLAEYFTIRESVYKEYLGLKKFSGAQDEFDAVSDIMVVRAGGKCVGGARLTVVRPGSEGKLPLESENYNLREYFSDFNFDEIAYCETSRMAFLPEFRTGEFVNLLCKLLAEHTLNCGAEAAFAIAPMAQVRRYKAILSSFGFNVIIRDDIKLPKVDTYEHIQPILWAVDFTRERLHSAALSGAPVLEYVTSVEKNEFEPA